MVLVDNLNWRTKTWSSLVERFAGREVFFLVTAREEDWKRYGDATLAFTWRIVRPTLSLPAAKAIYTSLDKSGYVHASVRSAEWAFERVHQHGPLIEYVYLFTHGQLLVEFCNWFRRPEEARLQMHATEVIWLGDRENDRRS